MTTNKHNLYELKIQESSVICKDPITENCMHGIVNQNRDMFLLPNDSWGQK